MERLTLLISMKVAVVSIGSFDTQYSDYHIIKDIILGLLESGYSVDLYQKQYLDIPRYPGEFDKYINSELVVYNIKFEKRNKDNLKARYIADLSYYKNVCKLLRKNKADKIFLQSNNTSFYTVYYAKHILHIPLLYNEQDLFPENALYAGIVSKDSLVYRIAHKLQAYTYKNASLISTISDDIKNTIVNRYHIDKDKIDVIYNWGHENIKAHSDKDNIFLKKYPKDKKEFRVLYAGNIGKMQNVELILKAANLLKDNKDIKFYIVGDGVNKDRLLKEANNKLDNVVFVKMQDQDTIADLYKSADVNLIPLVKGIIYVALPSKMADCLLANKPIITCVDATSEFVKVNKTYGINNVSPDSPSELKNEILNILDNKYNGDNKSLLLDVYDKKKNVDLHIKSLECLNNGK